MPRKNSARKLPRSHSVSSKSVPKSGVPKRRSVAHHAKRIWHVTPKFVHGAVAGAVIGILVVTQLGLVGGVSALSMDTPRDCDDYAIIKCGSLSTSELQRDYKKGNVADVYSHFGISSKDIASIDKTAVKGIVYDDGSIKISGKKVATDAITASWLSVNGSSKVKVNGTSFYVRHLRSSWSHKSAPAYVVMKNGEFKYAVLASCGNPIVATAIPAPKPAPKPAPAPPPAPPASTKPKPTPPTPTPPLITPPPLTITPVSTETEELPNVGPGALFIIAAASVLGGFFAHHTHRHLKRRRSAHAQSSRVGRHAVKHALHGRQ